ncbi:hypothetical protein EPUS_04199 [Endocarpon pusillum Z07020]|uniref:Uncharacterized protein n=1 Tax=Endocarpon pusillum (strain Z07020 / HMAS-L-300199) TaxID=1263415 RepID=U1GW69_ENDPU|nr:uncharacterized protein EPUS_04199 [Endocarpon pusillum Z07020]ERF76341.1 hypothetical protein EPUS_04199 [Endocarpon pusillum Z07020]
MKSKVTLAIDPKKARMEKKYVGDPDSPNFLPPSPLIDRRVLSAQIEGELKRVCATVLANEQSADDDLAVISRYLSSHPQKDKKPTKHDKHSSFVFQPPKTHVSELAAASFLQTTSKLPTKTQTQHKQDRQESAAVAIASEPLEPANTQVSRQKPSFSNTENEALYEIRRKLESRPKTSAAACIDYPELTSPDQSNPTTSVPSNRTTYSTPFTSAGVTPGQTSKRFSQSVPNAIGNIEIEPVETTALPKCPDDAISLAPEQTAQARAWMAEQLTRRRRSSSQTPQDISATRPLHEFHPLQSRHNPENSRPASRAASIRTNISNNIREYIRPGSSAGSIRSNHSISSNHSRTHQRISALKAKISSASLRSRSSSRRRPGYDDGDEYFINPEQVNLDRPLPPLPGLDSYREKPKHIGLMMKSMITPSALKRDTANVVIDTNGVERVMTAEEEKRRKDDLARAVLEKMSTGSIGSVPASPTGVISMYREGVKLSLDDELSRPVTSGSGSGVGAVPLYNRGHRAARQMQPEKAAPPAHPSNPRPVGGFVKRWGGRLGWGRKTKIVAIE